MNRTEAFASEARRYCEWLMNGRDSGEKAAYQGLVRLCRLYTAALELPRLIHSPESDTADVSQEEWQQAYTAAGRLPVGLYREVYDPVEDLSEEPVVGDLKGDLADIFRDVMRGLRAFDRGDLDNAMWAWQFGLAHLWGAHATAAMRVLHMWLQTNAPDLLRSPRADTTKTDE